MAYRRQANLPGTQQYGLKRRQTRTTEEFPYNPNLSRRRPPRAPATQDVGGPTALDVPGLEPGPEPVGGPAEIESAPMSENEQLAMNLTISEMGPDLSLSAFKGSVLGFMGGRNLGTAAKGGSKGLIPGSPIAFVQLLHKFHKSYNENLANIEASEAFAPATGQEESMAEPQNIAFGQKTDPTLSEPQHVAFGEPQPPALSEPQHAAFGAEPPAADIDSGMGTEGGDIGHSGQDAPATGHGDVDAGDGDGDGTVLCTALYNMGGLDPKIYKSDSKYAKKHIDLDTYTGYVIWAKHLAKRKWIVKLLAPWVRCWAEHMHYKMIQSGKINLVGDLSEKYGIPICRIIGKTVRYFNVKRNNCQRIFSKQSP